MANLGTWTIDTQGAYEKLEELTEETFTEGTAYTIQGIGADYFLREGTEGAGFKIADKEKVQWTAGSDDLYIKTMVYDKITVNIA